MIHVAVLAGGALGGLLRYVMTVVSQRLLDEGEVIPWWTLLANAAGSLALGLVAGSLTEGLDISPTAVAAIGAGFTGGLTTFSTFAVETVLLGHERNWWIAAAYVAASTLSGLLAVTAGIVLGTAIV